MPFIYFTHIEKEIQVDTAGNIYHLISRPAGLTLYKLSKKNNYNPLRYRIKSVYPASYSDTPYHFNEHLLKQADTHRDQSPAYKQNQERSIQRPTANSLTVTRSEALVIGEAYRDFQWTAIAGNISAGAQTVTDGHIIRTPSWISPIGAKTAVPYKWGGFSSLETYKTKAEAGIYTGSDYTSDVSPSDLYCVGVDCSGFVSRCWRLSSKYGTSTLPSISTELANYDAMKTGDIINLAGSHVRMFVQKEENGT